MRVCVCVDREDASSMATVGATDNTTVGNSRAYRESGLVCSHSHGESIGLSTQSSRISSIGRPRRCRSHY